MVPLGPVRRSWEAPAALGVPRAHAKTEAVMRHFPSFGHDYRVVSFPTPQPTLLAPRGLKRGAEGAPLVLRLFVVLSLGRSPAYRRYRCCRRHRRRPSDTSAGAQAPDSASSSRSSAGTC
jgi:hypothetical protein